VLVFEIVDIIGTIKVLFVSICIMFIVFCQTTILSAVIKFGTMNVLPLSIFNTIQNITSLTIVYI
jgi:hypothetical protein